MTEKIIKDKEPIRGPESIICPVCSKEEQTKEERAIRQGAQDECDIYLCRFNHLSRFKIGVLNRHLAKLKEKENGG